MVVGMVENGTMVVGSMVYGMMGLGIMVDSQVVSGYREPGMVVYLIQRMDHLIG